MIEANEYDSAEAGPSRARYHHSVARPTGRADGVHRSARAETPDDLNGEEEEDPEEILRENEVSRLEDDLQPRSTSASSSTSTSTSTSKSSLASHSRPTLQSRQSSNTTSKPASRTHVHVRQLEIPLHTSSSEIFDLATPVPEGKERKRPSTYSSLPSSPTERPGKGFLDAHADADHDSRGGLRGKGLGINDLDDVLNKLNASRSPHIDHAEDDDELTGAGVQRDLEQGEREREEFWPARSRRGTDGQDTLQQYDDAQEGPTSPTSPISPTSDPGVDTDGNFSDGLKVGGRVGVGVGVDSKDVLGIWDLLKDEVGAEDWDGWIADGKWERIANFLAVPLAVEKTTLFGALLCLDGFLYNFTILPIRASFAVLNLLRPTSTSSASSSKPTHAGNTRPPPYERNEDINATTGGWMLNKMPLAHQHSILRLLLLFIPTVVLLLGTDASKMYHSVRGQDTIKLYVIFNALEIADRLCGAFGQDVLDTLFARETLCPSIRKSGKGRKRQQARPLFFFALALGYVLAHTLIFFYMLVSLNVAINSYDYTLLSLLISNQFVEIKGSVFKKFEKENLFQIMCADIVERFQLSLMLSVIALRNMIEMAGSEIAFLPRSFMRGKSLVDAILSPILFVIVSEMVVDWLKHAFITKFNHVRASVYERFTDVLAKDVLAAGSTNRRRGRNQILLDQSPLVARRLGFASIPLACLVVRIGAQAIGMLASSSQDLPASGWTKGQVAWTVVKWAFWGGAGACAWGCLIFLKVLLGLSLLSFSATRQESMERREAEDAVNDFGRSAVGESKEETEYHKQTASYLSRGEDLPDYPSPASAKGTPHTPYTVPPPLPRFAMINHARLSSEPNGLKLDTGRAGTGGDGERKAGKAKGKGKKWKLEEVERWTMVKRIW